MKTEKQKTDTTASILVTMMPTGETIEGRSRSIANAAKAAVWASGGEVQADRVYLRAALCLLHMTMAKPPMTEAGLLASLLASSFKLDSMNPDRERIFSMVLDDPSDVISEAVRTNRRLLGLPPQLDLVPDDGTGETTP